MNTVPPSAASNLPGLRSSAPVNAPRSWPNSSFSISAAGSAAQSTFTNGPLRRGEFTCTARASSSLPEPLSPRMSTVASVAAAFCTTW